MAVTGPLAGPEPRRWLSIALLALAACGGRAETYRTVERCLEEEVCTCVRGADCPRGLFCIDGRCGEPDSVRGPGELGDRCEIDAECQSGACLPAGDGNHRRCSVACTESCPEGWRCVTDVRTDNGAGVCVQDQPRLCAPCAEDSECSVDGSAACLEAPVAGVCGLDCRFQADCPDGYACTALPTGERQCVPSSCACTSANAGQPVACKTENQIGTCWGEQQCRPNGTFGACSAPQARPEVCNGVDDDCDGLVDDEDPDVDRTGLPADPEFPACQVGDAESCRGTWRCDVAQGWVCEPAAPAEEICDGLDNDCDGRIDQPFVDAQGRHVTPEHCGGCNRSCTELIADLALTPEGAVDPNAATCELRAGVPTCRPLSCAPGFAPWPEDAPVTCTPAATVQCMACVDASDCRWSTHRCVQLGSDAASVCLQGCGPDAPAPGCTGQLGVQGCCPDGNTCQQVDGAPVCVPVGDGCDCNVDRVGVNRPCLRPGDGGAQCAGEQTCIATGGEPTWSSCNAAEVTREVCNGLDDDCNGRIDDDFLNTQGSGGYDTDEHCGQCYSSCLSLPNARGTCDPGEAPGCVISQCLPGKVPGGAFCSDDAACPSGYTCDARIFQCVRRCGAGCQGGDVCVDGFCTSSCGSDAACQQRFGPESTCEAGTCAAAYQYVDRDGEVSDGCECPVLAAGIVDTPDVHPTYPAAGAAYVDRDCDGVDGEIARSLFVRAGASGGNGTLERPFATIRQAIGAFVPARHDAILVAAGLYPETVTLQSDLHLFGGYSPDFASRDVAGRPTILAPPEPGAGGEAAVVLARDILGAATLAGFVVQGWDVSPALSSGADGDSSVAILLVDVGPGVIITNNLVRGGRGGDGAPGEAGEAGADGGAGADGRGSRECNTASCGGEQQGGGAPGRNASCSSANGTVGGSSRGNQNPQDYLPPLGKNGLGGNNSTYSSANNPQFEPLCKYDCIFMGEHEGQDASSGDPGFDGSGGTGCGDGVGRLAGEGWRATVARAGVAGAPGGGGGGGGGGGAVANQNPTTCTVGNRVGDLGGTGGGGGAGGCAGSGGGAGGGGGASIGILVVRTRGGDPRIEANRVVRGAGGDGGAGGTGGDGGQGGQGGNGGEAVSPAWCAGGGGKGGRGGDGGRGGGGGGGCGGVAYGIAGRLSSATTFEQANQFTTDTLGGTGGGGGAGGRSAAGTSADGTDGQEGDAGDVHDFR